MKTILRRVSELEKRFAPQIDEKDLRMYESIRESLRRLRARDGLEPVEDPPRVDDGYQPRTMGEAIRDALRRRRAAQGGEPVEDHPRVDDRYRPGTLGEAKRHAVSAVPSDQAEADAEGSGK
jgi:hypothetical protein